MGSLLYLLFQIFFPHRSTSLSFWIVLFSCATFSIQFEAKGSKLIIMKTMRTVVRKGQYYCVFMVLSLVTAGIILHDQLASAQNISHFVASIQWSFPQIFFPCCVVLLTKWLNGSCMHTWQVEEASFTRLCETKNILTVNRKFPAPTIYAHAGETLVMDVENKGNDNLTIFWYIILSHFFCLIFCLSWHIIYTTHTDYYIFWFNISSFVVPT